MLLSALVAGCKLAVGSTYNRASPLFAHLLRAFEEGVLNTADELRSQGVDMVNMINDVTLPFGNEVDLESTGIQDGQVPIAFARSYRPTKRRAEASHRLDAFLRLVEEGQ